MADIKAGDLVQLKSGGPRMTADEILGPTKSVRCVWFIGASGTWERREGLFNAESLKVEHP